MKAIIILLLITILYCLASAVFYLIRNQEKTTSSSMVKALSWRIGLSLLLFLLLVVGYAMGWLVPHGINH